MKKSQRESSLENISFMDFLILIYEEKLLILFFVFLGFFVGGIYTYSLKPTYQYSIVITSSSVANFGHLIREINSQSTIENNFLFEHAIELSESAIEVLKRNLMSTVEQQKFQQAHTPVNDLFSLSVLEDRARCKKITMPISKVKCDNIIISVSGSSRDSLRPFADKYLDYIAGGTAIEINEFLECAGYSYRFEAKKLYRIESAAVLSDSSFRVKKQLTFIFAIVSGCILGVFVVLVRATQKSNMPASI